MPHLTNVQKSLIRRYVKKLVGDELKILSDYLDLDRGLQLRSEVIRRLNSGKRSGKKLSHDEFWAKAAR